MGNCLVSLCRLGGTAGGGAIDPALLDVCKFVFILSFGKVVNEPGRGLVDTLCALNVYEFILTKKKCYMKIKN